MVWDALKSAKHDKTSLSAIWLDVANAYGSVPHRLVYFALKRYGVSELSWKHLLVTSPRLTSFVLGATFDTLPSPTNLKRWHITTEADCSLCSVKICTTTHVLSGCKVALSQGRYTFRHDSILRVLHNSF